MGGSRLTWTVVGYVVALAMVAVGVGWELGIGWGLVAGGLCAGGSIVVLVDVDGGG